jgi:hypothetical protein
VTTAEVLVGGTEPLKVPMAVSFAPNGQLLVVDTEPMIGLGRAGWVSNHWGFSSSMGSTIKTNHAFEHCSFEPDIFYIFLV